MDRLYSLTNEQLEQINRLLPPEQGRRGRPPTVKNREALEGILHVLRTGTPWRDLPNAYGPWHTIYMRWQRWIEVSNDMDAPLHSELMTPSQFGTVMPQSVGASMSLEPPESTSIHPASSRRLNQGRARLVTPASYLSSNPPSELFSVKLVGKLS